MIESGAILGERYKLLKTLGEGGMANVYLARDLILDRDVAVKVLRLDLQDDPDTLRRFRREAMATLELSHPNIVSIYDVGESDGQQYLVMEYVEGTDLKKYIAKNFPIPYARVIAMMRQILSAVQTAHDHNIIHRDLKPQNIMVDKDGTAKITDFGIAVALSDNSMTQTNSLLGSVHYLSPEQARGGMPTKQSDVYALGIILYELLTGSVPFEGDSAVSIALKHFQQEIPSVRDFDPRIPQALENVVLKATAKDPNQRYSSAQAMSDDLATALDPSRASEPRFTPQSADDMDETRVIGDLPSALRGVSAEQEADRSATQPLPQSEPEQSLAAETEKPKKTKKSKRKWTFGIIAGLILLALVGLAVAFWPKGDVNVPDVAGMSVTQAQSALEKDKLTVGTQTKEHSNKYSAGEVITSDPAADTSVKSGSAVNLIVSSGVQKVTMKSYRGETYADAATDLRQRGFKVERKTKVSTTATAGTVLSQSIPAGQKVDPKADAVVLTVARAGSTFEMSDLTQLNLSGVQMFANEHNLQFTSSGDSNGVVVSQSPAVGTKMHRGDNFTVVLQANNGPARSTSSNADSQSDANKDESSKAAQSSSSSSSTASDAQTATSSSSAEKPAENQNSASSQSSDNTNN
ncbi:Stk1 family PASTA domain-containing Ser/Thr kinase [Lacticaseibacillus zhaodongensis]|uniref:Stk1 family PASTA domain-containing Ser/Thr kinase n=1 Tax=Lacticaseibacillus zhaodongensis TaxID=2668065 RepID=UPI0012D2C411|nr:Stk1 family PASTA domain-containing Ser/Thr kinase [Lacticaseibacillus zhaodongensis]